MGLIDLIQVVEARVGNAIRRFVGLPSPTRRQRMQHSAEVAQVLGDLHTRIPKEANRLVKEEYNNEARKALNNIPNQHLFPPVTNFSQMNRDAVSILSDNLTHSLQAATETVGRRTDDIFRKHGLRAAAAQAARSNVPKGIQAGELQRSLEREGITSFVDKAGRRWTLSTYSAMVIRTTTSEAQNHAVYNLTLGRNLDLVHWFHSGRTKPCPICEPFVEQRLFSLTGANAEYPVLELLAPVHPRCFCNIMPARENFTTDALPPILAVPTLSATQAQLREAA
jgi:hypothetical protein